MGGQQYSYAARMTKYDWQLVGSTHTAVFLPKFLAADEMAFDMLHTENAEI
jgi:hypothetical protein